MDLSAFKAYDIRGEYPSIINEKLAFLVGQALAVYLSANKIVVGRDMRLSSDSLSKALICGLVSRSVKVIDIGLCTTPMLNFAIIKDSCDGGVMISASHNPASDNAFKLMKAGAIQIDETNGLNEIKKLVSNVESEKTNMPGSVSNQDILSNYIEQIISNFNFKTDLKIIIDYGNGVGALSAKPVMERLGIEQISLFEEPDGTFPNHPANPHDIANFTDLIEQVKLNQADLGILFDSDADRANFVDDKGRIVPIDLLVALLAQGELARLRQGIIYHDLRFSKTVPDIIKQAGGSPVMMRVGNPFYKEAMKADNSLLGAELSGHIMYASNFNIDDGLFAALKVIELITIRKQKLSFLIDSIKTTFLSYEESLETKSVDKVLKCLIEAFPEAKLIELDGLYLDFEVGFISVRQSQNEPHLLRFRAEASSEAELNNRLLKVRQIIEDSE